MPFRLDEKLLVLEKENQNKDKGRSGTSAFDPIAPRREFLVG